VDPEIPHSASQGYHGQDRIDGAVKTLENSKKPLSEEVKEKSRGTL
jgi:hypothetical protein